MRTIGLASHLNADVATTTDYTVRETAKILMAVLSLIGITGMYLRQVKQTGVLGLLGYVAFGAGYLLLMSVQIIGVFVLPFLAISSPDFVNDVLVAAVGGAPPGDIGALAILFNVSGFTFLVGGTPPGDIGALAILFKVSGFTFLAGGFLFGIALFRAGVLARWAAALLAVGAVATIATSALPQVNPRLSAIPIGVAMVGLGYSLWRNRTAPGARPVPSTVGAPLNPAGTR